MTTLWRYGEAYRSTHNRLLQSDCFFFNITKNENEAFISTNVPKIMVYINLFLSIDMSKIYKRHNLRICRGVLCFQIKLTLEKYKLKLI